MQELVSVVVPFYNEEENASRLYERISAVFANMPDYEFECLLVNDGSTDNTETVLDDLHKKDARVRPIHHARNFGQSAALVSGMRRAKGSYILTLDGDLQNDPCDFPKFLQLLKEYDCVCGYRAKRQDAWVRKMSSTIANRVRRAILDDGIRDSGCGSKGFRRVCIEHMIPFNGLHRFFAVMVRNGGLTLTECQVTHHPRQFGVSKYGIGNRLWRGIYDLIGVAWLKKRYIAPEVKKES
jgi:glycosyltransferase involved in cell wall biosynthesis